jgi:hypothetical protein
MCASNPISMHAQAAFHHPAAADTNSLHGMTRHT